MEIFAEKLEVLNRLLGLFRSEEEVENLIKMILADVVLQAKLERQWETDGGVNLD